jgi:isocitrate dehydrogenase kinase/phosphatase
MKADENDEFRMTKVESMTKSQMTNQDGCSWSFELRHWSFLRHSSFVISPMSRISIPALTDSRLASLCAKETREALDEYETRFGEITRRARDRFLARDWRGSYQDAAERLRLYSVVLDSLTSRVTALMGPRLRTRAVWSATKAVYSSLIAQSIRWEVAESFFNSLTRRVFATEGVDQAIEFVDTDFDAPPNAHGAELCRTYAGAVGLLLRER